MKNLVLLFLLLVSCFGFSQQADIVDFKKIQSVVIFNQIVIDSTNFNSFEIDFEILKKTDSIYLDAIDMKYRNVVLNNEIVEYKNDGKKLIVYHPFEAYKNYKLSFYFFASPKKAMYFIDWYKTGGNTQIWTQGQGKYTSNWLPSIDDMNDKMEFDLTFVAPKGYQVISNGEMVSKNESPNYNLWEFDMKNQMSSYLAAVVVGKYDKKIEYSKSGVPLEMYYYPEDSLKVEPTYRYTKQMFDFLEDEIGVPYPWQNYKQVPVKDFLYAGMENTSATIFSDAFVVDSIGFNDKNYVNVNAHELAHQWFGDLVTAKSGEHHWLQEGFATYYALLAERDIFGDNYYYWRLYEYAQELLDQDRRGASTALLNPKSSSATFYKKGCLVLHVLREKVGDEAFKKAVKNYLENHQFKNVETQDFIAEVEKTSKMNLSDFVETWLNDKTFYYKTIENLLYKQSTFIQEYIQVDCENYSSKCKDYLSSWISDEAKIKVIRQIPEKITKEDFKNSVKVRQAIAQNMHEIPLALKTQYESLLNDESYVTIEAALFTLWKNFPLERQKYLDKTKDIHGFNDKNVRILWLTLNLVSPDFEDKQKRKYYQELINYTSSRYSFEVRQNAFQYLNQIKACNDVCKENLKQATKHHNWRFSKFAKELLKHIDNK